MEKSLVPQCAHTDGGRCARCAAPMNPQLQSRFKSSLMHNVSMIIFRGSIDNEIAQRFIDNTSFASTKTPRIFS